MIILYILLTFATLTDLVKHKIPNVLSLGGILIGLLLQVWSSGFLGLVDGMAGLMVGFILFLPAYVIRVMGAGDVKLMAMVGTFAGPKIIFVCIASTLVFGMLIGVLYSAYKGKTHKLMKRYFIMIKTLILTLHWSYIPPNQDDAGVVRFPYAIAIFTGTVFSLWYMDITSLALGF